MKMRQGMLPYVRSVLKGGSKKHDQIDETIDCANISNKHMIDHVDVVPATTKTYWDTVYEHILSGLS